jgi:YfiH family protein
MCAPIGLFLGRIANFINGELYGRHTASALGMVFPNSDGIPRHPSQLYEAFMEGLIPFAILQLLWRVNGIRNRSGLLSFIFGALYSIARIGAEFFREPDAHIGFLPGGTTMGQLLTLPVLLAAAVGLVILSKRKPEAEIFVSSPLLNDFQFATNRFFTRQGGVSEGVFASANCRFETSDAMENVRRNRALCMDRMKIAPERLVTLSQQHTDKVVLIDRPVKDAGLYLAREADAIITNQPGLAVGVLTADCVPLLLLDAKNKWVAAAHCGWKGIYRDIIKETVGRMESLGSNPRDIYAALGPCLKRENYEVDPEFMENIAAQDESFRSLFRPAKVMGKRLFDCTGYCLAKLRRAGVRNIDVMDFDTYDPDLFFSYRRSLLTGEHASGGPADEGRQLSAIAIKE